MPAWPARHMAVSLPTSLGKLRSPQSAPLVSLNMSPSASQQLLQAQDSTLNAEFHCTKEPLFQGGRNPAVRVMLLESSEENPQLTWMLTCSPGSFQ